MNNLYSDIPKNNNKMSSRCRNNYSSSRYGRHIEGPGSGIKSLVDFRDSKNFLLIFGIIISIFVCLISLLINGISFAGSASSTEDVLNFRDVVFQELDSETPYSIIKTCANVDFYGNRVNVISDQSDNVGFKNSETGKSKNSSIGPDGYKIYTSSQNIDNVYENYIKITPNTKSTLDIKYKANDPSEIPYVRLFSDSITGKEIELNISSLPEDDGTILYTASTNGYLTQGVNYYIVLSDNNVPSKGINLTSLIFTDLVKKENLAKSNINQSQNLTSVSSTLSGASLSAGSSVGNNGYPYMVNYSGNSQNLQITVDYTGASTGFQWQVCENVSSAGELDKPDNTWTNIDSATTQTSTIKVENLKWYRCVVSTAAGNVFSEAIQAVYFQSRWYLGNGAAAGSWYSSNRFDVIGRYEKLTNGWVNGVYSCAGIKMITWDTPNPTGASGDCKVTNVKFNFNKKSPKLISTSYNFQESVGAFAIWCDTQIAFIGGGGTPFPAYDTALFKSYLNANDELVKIQMISTSAEPVTDTMGAWVMGFNDSPWRYYIGLYYEVSGWPNVASFNMQKGGNYINGSVNIPGDTENPHTDVVLGVQKMDSGFSIFWKNITNNKVTMTHSLGSVAETGAIKIEATASSSTVINVKNADTNKYYALYKINNDETETLISSIAKPSTSNIAYEGLIPDQDYIVKASTNEEMVSPDTQDVRTFINPNIQSDHETNITITPTGDSVVLANADPDYTYALTDTNGAKVTAYLAPTYDGKLTLTKEGGLSEETQYYLVAQSIYNDKSDSVAVTTTRQLNANVLSSSEIEIEGYSGNTYEIWKGDTKIKEEARTVDETFNINDLDSDTDYNIKCKSTDTGIDLGSKIVTTWIDPRKDKEQNNLTIEPGPTYIKIYDAEVDYLYYLEDAMGNKTRAYAADIEGVVTITKCPDTTDITPDTTYYLTAKSDTNSLTEKALIITHPDYTVTVLSSSSIKISDLDTRFEYALFKNGVDAPVYDWHNPSAEETEIIIDNLSSDTKYTAKMRSTTYPADPGINEKPATTYINPLLNPDQTSVKAYQNINTLTLTDINSSDYQYAIWTNSECTGDSLSGWVSPSDGKMIFNGLNPGTNYYIKAKSDLNSNSDIVCLTTHDDFAVLPDKQSTLVVSEITPDKYDFRLIDASTGNIVNNWTLADSDEIKYEELNPDTLYRVEMKETGSVDFIPDQKEAWTFISPLHSPIIGYVDNISVHDDKFFIHNVDQRYTYYLTRFDDPTVVQSIKPAEGQEEIEFADLISATKYVLTATRAPENTNSDFGLMETNNPIVFTAYNDNSVSIYNYLNDEETAKYDFQLLKTDGDKDIVVQVWQPYEGEHEHTYTNLWTDSIYKVQLKKKDSLIPEHPQTLGIQTWINPGKTKGTLSSDDDNVNYYENINRIFIRDWDPSYKYKLYSDASTTVLVTTAIEDIEESSRLVMNGLSSNTIYYLKGERQGPALPYGSSNYESAIKTIKTNKDFTITPISGEELKVSNNEGYEYRLDTIDGDEIYGWDSHSGDTFIYSVQPNTKYKVSMRARETLYPDVKETRSLIDPLIRKDYGNVDAYSNVHRITLTDCDPSYEYALYDSRSPRPASLTYVSPNGDGVVVFTDADGAPVGFKGAVNPTGNLDSDTEYELVARENEGSGNYYELSEVQPLRTHKDYTAEPLAGQKIKVKNNTGYKYALFKDGIIVSDYETKVDAVFNYEGLDSDADYQVKMILADKEELYPDSIDIRTFIDPLKTKAQDTVLTYDNLHAFTLLNADPAYKYAIWNKESCSGDSITGWVTPSTGENKVFFGTLDSLPGTVIFNPDTSYYLKACANDNTNSNVVKMTTHKDYSLEPINDSVLKSITNNGYYYALFKEGSDTPVVGYDWKYSTGFPFTYSDLESDTIYYEKQKTATNELYPDVKEAWTFIDPLQTHNHSVVDHEATSNNELVLYNADTNYEYKLMSEDGTAEIKGWQTPDLSGKLIFTGLDSDTTYKLYAEHATDIVPGHPRNRMSISYDLTTINKEIDEKPESSTEISCVNDSLYQYRLLDDEGNVVPGYDWTKYSSGLDRITYENLIPDRDYIIEVKKSEIDTPNRKIVRTKIDPTLTHDLESIDWFVKNRSMVMANLDPSYEYAVIDASSGVMVCDWESPVDRCIEFDGLLPNCSYELIAKSDLNPNSDKMIFYTLDSGSANLYGDWGFDDFTWNYKDDVIDIDSSTSYRILNLDVYVGTEYKFNDNKVTSYFMDPNGRFTVEMSAIANNDDGYLFDYWTVNGEMVENNKVYTVNVEDVLNIVPHFKHDTVTVAVNGLAGHDHLDWNFEYENDYIQKFEINNGNDFDLLYENAYVNTIYKFDGQNVFAKYEYTPEYRTDILDLKVDPSDPSSENNVSLASVSSFEEDALEIDELWNHSEWYKVDIKTNEQSNYTFNKWTINGSDIIDGEEYTIESGKDFTITAHYEPVPENDNTPKTGDNIWLFVLISGFIVSSAGIFTFLKRRNNK